MTAVLEHAGVWFDHFSRQDAAPEWAQDLRRESFERFSNLNFPATSDEDWRFTNVAPIARVEFSPAPAAVADPVALAPHAAGFRLVFVNGRLTSWTAGLQGVHRRELLSDEAKQHLGRHARQNAFVSLNTAFLKEGAFLEIARGAIVEHPIHFVYISAAGESPVVTHPRSLIVVGARAHCKLVETYVGTGRYFTNGVTEIVAGEGAVVDHYKFQNEAPESFHVATMQAAIGRSANFSSCSISLGGRLARNDIGVIISEGADASLNGLYIAEENQHVDHHTTVDHAGPNANSRELYKGILSGESNGVFNGKILVRPDAQKTDARQTNQNLLLSDNAAINTKPELQIHADDVRCTHGATVGQLDASALFYLQSRGIGKKQALSILTRAFAQDIADRIKISQLKHALERAMGERFDDHGH